MKRSIFKNSTYVCKQSMKAAKPLRIALPLYFLSTFLLPLSVTLLSSRVVYALTNGYSVFDYLLIIFLFVGISFVLSEIRMLTQTYFTWENTFCRCHYFWLSLSEQQLKTDYVNVEPKNKQKEARKAFEALNSNWEGLELMLKSTPEFYVNAFGMIVYGVIVALYSPYILIIFFLMTIVNYFLTRIANTYYEKKREESSNIFNEKYVLTNTVGSPEYGKDVRIYGMKKWLVKLINGLTKKRLNIVSNVAKRFLFANMSNTIFLFIRDLVAYIVLIVMVVNKEIDVSTFTFLIGIVAGFSNWLNGFVTNFNNLRNANIMVNDYFSLFDRKNVFNHDKGIDISSLKAPFEIEFKDVSFTYPEAEKETISHLSFKISKGEKVALVGNNGAGKTTIIKLLCGLYPASEGEILINGHNVMEFNNDDYMRLFSVVFQDSEPFAFTIKNNITCVKDSDVDYDLFWDSLEKAGLKEKIESLPNKEESFISERFDTSGIRLSGGETQKLMLARALYKNAPILVLDEPTAALDPLSEERMYLTYQSFAKGNTSLFISHRLSSTKFCDRILFLENGNIIESGTHDELLAAKKEYAKLFDVQAQYYREDGETNENQE